MAHIHTGPAQHDATVTAYIFRLDGPEPKLLLHIHKKFGKYLQFGGHVELNENPWDAVKHEITEESGYKIEQLKLLQPKKRLKHLSNGLLHPQSAVANTHEIPGINHLHSDLAFAFTTLEEPAVSVTGDESNDFRLFTRSELEELTSEQIIENVRELARYMFDEILNDWEEIDPKSYS